MLANELSCIDLLWTGNFAMGNRPEGGTQPGMWRNCLHGFASVDFLLPVHGWSDPDKNCTTLCWTIRYTPPTHTIFYPRQLKLVFFHWHKLLAVSLRRVRERRRVFCLYSLARAKWRQVGPWRWQTVLRFVTAAKFGLQEGDFPTHEEWYWPCWVWMHFRIPVRCAVYFWHRKMKCSTILCM